MKRKYLRQVMLLTSLICSLQCISSYANYGNALYTDLAYTYASECDMSTAIYNETQIRINKAVYGQAAVVFSQDHFEKCYGTVNTPLFNSFKDHFTPLVPLAFSVAEWGGNGDLKYSFTPAIATDELEKCGVILEFINPLEINTQTYLAVGAKVWDTRRYYGPLQIDKEYMVANAKYTCGYVPMDYYCWPDACQWTFHNKCDSIKRAYCPDREFSCPEEVIAITSIAHNSGGTFIDSRTFNTSAEWYPWRDSESVWNYCAKLVQPENLQIIRDAADSYANELKVKFQNNEENGALYLSVSQARELWQQMGFSLNTYLKDHYSSGMTDKAWEKTMYPIQSIWNYRVLENLYGLSD